MAVTMRPLTGMGLGVASFLRPIYSHQKKVILDDQEGQHKKKFVFIHMLACASAGCGVVYLAAVQSPGALWVGGLLSI